MSLDSATKKKLARLAARDRKAQAAAKAARDEFFDALVEARTDSTVRDLADVVGLSYQRVHELTTVRNRHTAAAARVRASGASK